MDPCPKETREGRAGSLEREVPAGTVETRQRVLLLSNAWRGSTDGISKPRTAPSDFQGRQNPGLRRGRGQGRTLRREQGDPDERSRLLGRWD